MNVWLVGILALFGLAILWIVRQSRRAGPRELSDSVLERASPLLRVTHEDPGAGWEDLGRATRADGLRLRFDHDDDPEAEASLRVSDGTPAARGTLANSLTVRLRPDYVTEHVHTSGYVFRLRLRGTGAVVGKEVQIQMAVADDGRPYAGGVENDDDTDAAVGDWIEVDWAEILRVAESDRS